MKMRTHYFTGIAVSSVLTLFFVQVELWGLIWVISAPILGIIALLPDYLDQFPCSCSTLNVPLRHCRHPSTHHPLTFLYFIPVLLLSIIPGVEYLSIFLTIQCCCIWESHIIVDMLNPSGIPIGFRAVFSNSPSRDYLWKQYDSKAKTIRIGKIHYNNNLANSLITLGSIGMWSVALLYQGVGNFVLITNGNALP